MKHEDDSQRRSYQQWRVRVKGIPTASHDPRVKSRPRLEPSIRDGRAQSNPPTDVGGTVHAEVQASEDERHPPSACIPRISRKCTTQAPTTTCAGMNRKYTHYFRDHQLQNECWTWFSVGTDRVPTLCARTGTNKRTHERTYTPVQPSAAEKGNVVPAVTAAWLGPLL